MNIEDFVKKDRELKDESDSYLEEDQSVIDRLMEDYIVPIAFFVLFIGMGVYTYNQISNTNKNNIPKSVREFYDPTKESFGIRNPEFEAYDVRLGD